MRTPKAILERRRSVRVEEALPFQIGRKGYEQKAVTVNISRHGVMCLVNKDVAQMTLLDVALILPVTLRKSASKTSTLRLKGVVVRKEKDPRSGRYFLAVFFPRMKPQDEKLLNVFIDTRLKK